MSDDLRIIGPPPSGEGNHAQHGGGGLSPSSEVAAHPLHRVPRSPSPDGGGPVCVAFAANSGGGLATHLHGAGVILRCSGALWIPSERTLIVADLHLEKGSSYAARGQMLPPYDTRETLARLSAEVAGLAPATIVLLGDTFHDRRSEDRLAGEEAGQLVALAVGRRLVWVVGNHDVDGPRHLPGDVVDELSLAGLILRHEPQPGPQPGEVAGHLHPAARVRAPRGTVRRRCFITDGTRLILPAFGAYAGGLNVRDTAFAGMWVRPPLICALGSTRVRGVGWGRCVGD